MYVGEGNQCTCVGRPNQLLAKEVLIISHDAVDAVDAVNGMSELVLIYDLDKCSRN